MRQKPITHTLVLSFIWSFAVSITSFVGLMILGVMEQQHEGISPVAMLLVILIFGLTDWPACYFSAYAWAHQGRPPSNGSTFHCSIVVDTLFWSKHIFLFFRTFNLKLE